MSQSPSINPNRQFGFLQSSSTPLFLQNSSPHRFKSTSLKQINHSKLRNQSSPYYINNQQQLQDRQINPANILFNYQHCDDSESDITSTSQDTSISSFTKTNPPTTPISSLIATSTESSPSLITKTEILYVTPASNSLDSSRPISSDVTSYSRSSSYTSLSSFEIKSTHSSLQSDYSNQPNSANFTDLPNSPSAQSPTVLNNFVQNYSMDSNPSKSNDITVMEKTVLAANCSRSNYEIEDEQVISYDMEGSISGRSNVSQLTFPNEPTADLAFIRNLLDTKKNQKNEWSNLYTPPVKLDSSSIQQQKNLDMLQVSKSLFPDFRNDFFTVASSDSDMDKDSIKFYNDEEDRESCTSKASVPSIIRNDMENNLLNKIHLNVLYDKLNSTKDSSLLERTQVNEMSHVEEEGEEEEEEDDQKILFEFIDECFKNNKNLNDEDDKLPKINEEEEENECSFVEKIKINKKPVPVVQMTKTTMLRANKLKEMSQAKGQVNQSSVKKSLPQVCKTNTSSTKPNFKFINSNSTSGPGHLNNNKKTSQVLTSINNNWHSK
ncbi:unnamed protein product [Brachionus calyciflorus]|uniref:Uncharacterized protein n=1 Tax=Brachionus calyciflorus TaxID=104777 RepID=A0A813UL20_9BILA|nr:unnamed protein product [Brachionus calyciflorus]